MDYKIWVISELYYPEETSTGHFLTRIAEGLAIKFNVGVLCAQPTYSMRGIKASNYERRNGVEIHRCWSTALNKDVLPFRLINLITISLSIFISTLIRIHRSDRILIVTNPPLLPFVVAVAAKLRGADYILLIHDIYPDVFIATGLLSENSVFSRIITVFNQYLYRNAERLIVIGRDMQALVRSKLGGNSRGRLVLIPNWGDVDIEVANPRYENPLLLELGINDKLVIQYSGNMGRTHDLGSIIKAADRLRDNPGVHFLLIGFGAKRNWLESEVKRNNLKNITILPYRPRSELAQSLQACDLSLISFIPGMAGISVPSRMYDVFLAGKPILALADEESELAMLINEERIGWVSPPQCVESLVANILMAQKHPEMVHKMGVKARKMALEKYRYENVMKSYINLFTELEP